MLIAYLIIAYLIGSLSPGLIIARVKGLGLSEIGSGIGAAKISKLIGRSWFLPIALFDIAKGVVLVKVGIWLTGNIDYGVLLGIACLIGHRHSIFLKFRGDTGVAIANGVVLATTAWFPLVIADLLQITLVICKVPRRGAVYISAISFAALVALLSGLPNLTKVCLICFAIYAIARKATANNAEEIELSKIWLDQLRLPTWVRKLVPWDK